MAAGQMAAHCVHRPGSVPSPNARVQVQETRVALFSLRLMLLHHDPQLHIYLASTIQLDPLDCLLLPEPWLVG